VATFDEKITLSSAVGQQECFVCGRNQFCDETGEYRRCGVCGHELIRTTPNQQYMLNDPLDRENVKRLGALDRFKQRVLQRYCRDTSRSCLLDIGSSTGKFLAQNTKLFARVVGIEVTPEAIQFSRDVLGLEIYSSIEELNSAISVATFWHSLEHIPVEQLLDVLAALSQKMAPRGRVIVSVPNNRSFQYCYFRKAYAFYDVPRHIHQFSPASLERLFERFGFVKVSRVFSWPYNVFGYIQSLLNVLTGTHNYLYYKLKRRSAIPSRWQEGMNIVLLPLVAPVGLILMLLDVMFPDRQGVLTLCFQKKSL
jgi:2-polyprenyl-3-methyl-5-hydroxy-6-metoxy-1,4-benzoquinol methylase